MEWIETTAESVEQAVELALDQLGVDESELEFEVLEEPRTGFLKRRPARIRARVLPVSREKPDTRRRRRRDEKGRPETTAATTTAGREGGSTDVSAETGGTRTAVATVARETEVDTTTTQPEPDLDEQATVAQAFIEGLVDAFGLHGTVSTTIVEGTIAVSVEGEGLGILIGPRAATIDALHELTRTALQRHTGGQGARVSIDVAGYRERRRAALEDFARGVAERAVESGRDQALEPMSPPDRKVVHDVVATVEGAATISEGEEPRRRVVVRRA